MREKSPALWLTYVTAAALWIIPMGHAASSDQFTAHDFSRLWQLCILAVGLALWISNAWAGKYKSPKRPLLLAFIGCLSISTMVAAHPWLALREVALFASLMAFAVVAAEALTADRIRIVLRVMAIGTLTYGVLVAGIAAAALIGRDAPFAGWEMLVGFDNPRFLNHAQTIAIPLTAAVIFDEQSTPKVRFAALAGTLLSGGLLFICQGRAAVLALIVGLALSMWYFRASKPWRVAGMISAVLLAGAFAVGLIWHFSSGTANIGIGNGDSIATSHSRDYLILRAYDSFKGAPWFGVGPMHLANVYNEKASHPHNIYVQLIAELGILGSVILFLLSAKCISKWVGALRLLSTENLPLALALFTALVGVLVDGLFSGNFVMPISQLWIAILVALLMATNREASSASQEHVSAQKPSRWPKLYAGFGVLALVLTCPAIFEGLTSDPLVLTGANPRHQFTIAPRFWSHGWF